jgi:hypothetical protein
MSECRPSNDAQPLGFAARCNSVHDGSLPGFLLVALLCCGDALADDQASHAKAASKSTVDFTLPKDLGARAFSSTEFRPRKHTAFDREPPAAPVDAPMLQNTTVWQRMSEYRSQDRVRLLTLWESSGSAVSLQAGKHGDPSLQWNSRVMNREGSTRGLFDRLLSISFGGTHNGPHSAPTSAPAAPKPAGNPVVAGLK